MPCFGETLRLGTACDLVMLGEGAVLKVRDRRQSGRSADTCHRSGDDYCTTGFGHKRTFTTKKAATNE
jgi:hypothetical protein